MVLVVITLFGFALFLTNSFGYADSDTQTLKYASMTMFKLFIGRGVGDFYRTASIINHVNGLFFFFAFVGMFYMFNSIVLVIVS